MVDLSVNLCGTELKNPIIPASGTFGFGHEFSDIFDLNLLGAISLKGTTREARYGNEQPRIAETPSGMLNAVGLQNPGVKAVISEEIPTLRKCYSGIVIANIGGFSLDEFEENVERFAACKDVDILEVNISCPNLHEGGKNFGSSAEGAASVVRVAKKAAQNKPLFMKLSPNVADITEIARACESEGADGLTLINTLLGMRIDIARRRTILANKTGGLSGPAIFPVALRMVYQVYHTVKIPIIGCGGISKAEDVIEMMLSGASAVEIGAANLVNPSAMPQIISQLPVLCDKLRITSLKSIIGAITEE